MEKSTKLLVGAAAAVCVGVVLFVIFLDRSTHSSREAALQIYEGMKSQLAQTITTGQQRLETVIADPRAAADEDCHIVLAEALERHADEHDVFLRIRPDGILDCTPAGAPADEIDLSSRLYFDLAVENDGPAVGEFLVGRVSNEPVLAVSNVLRNEDGSIGYVFATGLKLNWLKSVIETAANEYGLVVELHDAAGVPLSYFEDSSALRTFGQSTRAELVRLPILPDQTGVHVVILEQL